MVLEEHLGELPEAWHLLTVGELEALEPAARRVPCGGDQRRAAGRGHRPRGRQPRRACSPSSVVPTCCSPWPATTSPASRSGPPVRTGSAGGLTSIARIAVPVVLWISMMFTWREPFSLPRLLLVDNVAGEGLWRYWFVEILVQLLVVLTVVLAVRPVRDLERRRPFGFAVGSCSARLLVRHGSRRSGQPIEPMYRTDTAAWLFFAGWAAQRAGTTGQRVLVAGAVALVGVPGFFDGSTRGLVVAAGLLVLVWVPRLRVPAPFHRVLAVVAGASLWIFLTHFAAFPLLRPHLEPVVLFARRLPDRDRGHRAGGALRRPEAARSGLAASSRPPAPRARGVAGPVGSAGAVGRRVDQHRLRAQHHVDLAVGRPAGPVDRELARAAVRTRSPSRWPVTTSPRADERGHPLVGRRAVEGRGVGGLLDPAVDAAPPPGRPWRGPRRGRG